MLRGVGWCWFIIGLAAIPFAILALIENSIVDVRGFAASAVAGIFMGGLALIGTQSLKGPARAPAALRLSLYTWLTTPLIAAPPFILMADNPAAGLFEAYSSMTTTGATALDVNAISYTLILWRSTLQWIGGFASLVLIVTIFAAIEPRGSGLRRSSLLTVEDEDLFTNFGRAVKRLGIIYGIISIVGFAALSMSGVEPYSAVILTMSSISTGGMTPFDGPLDQYVSSAAITVMVVLTFLGAWNMAAQYEILSRGRATRSSGDWRALLSGIAIASGLALVLEQDAPALAKIGDTIFAMTTSGFQTGQTSLPAVYLLALAMIGGSVVSTTGGLKITRIVVLIRRASNELSRLAYPSTAARSHFAGQRASDSLLTSAWLYALAFPIGIAFTTILFGVTGEDLDTSWKAATALLTNAGPLAGIDFSSLSSAGFLVGCLAMVFGRLEILIAFAALFVIFSKD